MLESVFTFVIIAIISLITVWAIVSIPVWISAKILTSGRASFGTIELFCEKNNINFSDGFSLYWDPERFKDSETKVNKLHGSLYWFRTKSGKIIKVPMKGMTVKGLRYLSDEEVSEMMIYPALQKNKQSEVY